MKFNPTTSISLSRAHSLRGGPAVARVDVIAAARITFERGPSFASVGHKMEHKVTRHAWRRAVGYSNSSSVYIGSRIQLLPEQMLHVACENGE